ncbi:putative chromatin remodeling & transcriptional activation CHROMO-DOMAIN family [Helianthus annuus]|uniref:Chromatin remodeling & transcriptional activation CHROMO-DOMAIN family n=1 Tax=Helianthus annuus TaxID=4232 RepID=A0A251UIJ0_HELAN|nr:uncharacterized protein LOC110864597 isoform X2 [Helianthus annuus]XP_035830274.1 uncharacterized protein LOC110864597 isoform X2 [Helianthus annuus]KAF5801058.1 putative chromatin remodeling & transcriptional activation CHROMO-DOMAIN family [Helianthus annuus]KAJ0559395.1 putative chromatin remodeling & transcriptional activation CHROMO-DOMAIN family [Helianthus annuus]KAJ0572365.1 putative chromatin remodeling & transcriptional activation CHROMO-DOMAIN family [Helianthus annuus]
MSRNAEIRGVTGAQACMKFYADSKRRDVEFQAGEWVYVKLQPFRQHSLRLHRHYKLNRRYFGPYQVLEKVGQVAYKLNLPSESKIHNVFHVSMLRKCIGTPNQQVTPLHLVDSSTTLILEPFAVLDQRTLFRGSTPIPQYLIQWSGLPATDATWEDKTSLQKSFPNFHLEDKVFLNEGGNVVPTTSPTKSQEFSPQAAGPNQIRKSERAKVLPAKLKDYKLQ